MLAAVHVMADVANLRVTQMDTDAYGSPKDIRRLYEMTQVTPNQPTAIVLPQSDTLSIPAQNTLLKLLEEPPKGYHFILTATAASQLLPTIVSRAQRIRLLPLLDDQIQRLLDQLGVNDPLKRQQLTFLAAGLPLELERLATDDAYFAQKSQIMRDARTLLQSEATERLKIAHTYRDDRETAAQLLIYAARQLTASLEKSASHSLSERLAGVTSALDALAQNANVRLTLLKIVI